MGLASILGNKLSQSSLWRQDKDGPESISPSVVASADVVEDSTSIEMAFDCISSFSETYRFFVYTQELG
jgi:hypothetical protein